VPSEQPHRKPHIYLGPTGRAEPYTSPSTGRRPKPDIPPRNRQEHGSNLFSHLRRVQEQQDTLLQEAGTYELASRLGIQVEFESFPGIEMAVESLADARQQIELQNIIHRDGKTTATVFVPEGKLSAIDQACGLHGAQGGSCRSCKGSPYANRCNPCVSCGDPPGTVERRP
jgi:hypothetical protein